MASEAEMGRSVCESEPRRGVRGAMYTGLEILKEASSKEGRVRKEE